MDDISDLAQLLRESGDDILNAGSKLAMSVSLIQNLNEAFILITENQDEARPSSSSFEVINTNNFKQEIFNDLAFLHDFLQMTPKLAVTCALKNSNLQAPVLIDINKFKVLKCLEIRKVKVNKIHGMEHFRGQLHELMCVHSLKNLKSVLVLCGADQSVGCKWSKLHIADFSFNKLKSLDYSLSYAPRLQVLDLSNNLLVDAKHIICLPNLTTVNLNYNLLESIPRFHDSAKPKLQLLYMKFNHVDDITEVACLENLTHLDISFNCLMEHNDLPHLLHLPALVWLNLKENPIAYHRSHRFRTLQYIHINVITGKFRLDDKPLKPSEHQFLGIGVPLPVQTSHHDSELTFDDNLSSTVNINEPSSSQGVQTPASLQLGKKAGKVREAVISEVVETDDIEPKEDLKNLLEVSTEHLETKKKIESLREEFGQENWLHSRGGSCVQDILGLPQSYKSTLSCTPPSKIQSEDQANLIHHAILSSMPVQGPSESSIGDKVSVDPQNEFNEMNTSTDSMFDPRDPLSELPEQEYQYEDGDDEGVKTIYLVEHAKNPGEGIFLVITEKYIKEKEAGCGSILTQWPLESLMSAVRLSNIPAHVLLSFRTVRRDRQERIYAMDESDAQEVVAKLNEMLASQIFRFIKSFCCMKCSTQFSVEEQDSNYPTPKNNKACPTCQSTYVIEMDEVPSPEKQINKTEVKSIDVTSSPHRGSIRTTTVAQSPSQSSIGSAASLDPSPEGFPTANGTLPTRSDSDVEVISNPSQSSIEILEDSRRDALAPPTVLPSARSQLLSLVGLTESSSSGSLTDSVCTAYENHVFSSGPNNEGNIHYELSTTTPVSEESEFANSEGESTETLPLNLTSMLEDVHNLTFNSYERLPAFYNTESDKTESSDFTNKVQYDYCNYAQVDHRVKLHLYHQVFKDKNEELIFLIRAYIVPVTTTPYPGCIVFSNCSVYLLQVTGFEGDDPCLWLLQREVVPIPRVKGIQVLPWCQGFCLEFRESESSILVLLDGVQQTSNLFRFLQDISLPEKCVITSTLSLKHKTALQQLYVGTHTSEKPTPLQHLSVFTACKVFGGCGVTLHELLFGFFFVTETVLILSKGNLQWLFPQSTSKLEAAQVQSMSNLMQVQVSKQRIMLEFLNETHSLSSEEIWIVDLKSTESLQHVVRAIKQSWEELFAVPLQVTETLEIQGEM